MRKVEGKRGSIRGESPVKGNPQSSSKKGRMTQRVRMRKPAWGKSKEILLGAGPSDQARPSSARGKVQSSNQGEEGEKARVKEGKEKGG